MISKKNIIALTTAMLMAAPLWAANTKETVETVAQAVTLTADVDYIVTASTPFATDGVVNIENTEHAVLILAAVKPSAAIPLLLRHVQIGGQRAVNNQNCQVKLYNRGCIILPYGNSCQPLTVFSEQHFAGEQCSDFGLENSGGFMNTLSDEKLNNRIRSFRLKRGYMVTFALQEGGRGYSRCFIAADKDLEMPVMPAIMDRSISSYRVFKWYDAGKPQLAAAAGDDNACSALNVTSTYTWSAGATMLPNVEVVAHQIYSGWPSAASCGGATYTCHLKTSNEPRNNSDDHPEDLNAILNNWESLMRTGMRLCTPSSWDGSDYWNGTGFLKQFLDSIDARGWRCDVLDMHCYWPEGNFGNLRNWVNAVHRPIWISEWCWGASWNSNGAFASGVSENQVRDALQRICNNLNGMDYVERYFYWNGERDPSRIYKNGALTPAGQMYSQLDGGLAYNGKYDYVPKAPKQRDPASLIVDYDKDAATATISWQEYNGEMNEYIHLERREHSSQAWTVVQDIAGGEKAGTMTVSGVEAKPGWEFRIVEKDANGTERRTRAVMVASNDLQPGDAVTVGEKTMYLGGNIFTNGDFSLGLYGWQNGKGDGLGMPYFQAVTLGGSDGGPYLQCYGHSTSMNAEQTVKTIADLQPAAYYYFSADACNLSGISNLFSLTTDGTSNDSIVAMLDNSGANWNTLFATFNSGNYTKAMLALRGLACKAQFDNVLLCRLFPTREEAIADGARQMRRKAQACIDAFGTFCSLADELLTTYDDPKQDLDYVAALVSQTVEAQRTEPLLRRLHADAKALTAAYPLPGHEQVEQLCADIDQVLSQKCRPAALWIIDTYDALLAAVDQYMPMSVLRDKVQSPDFATANGWQTKTGTYQGGDQRTNTVDGVSFWNAWWNIALQGNETQTMAIRQQIEGLSHGLYAVQCQAATEHYCLSDQHAYATNGTDTLCSPTLTADRMDLTSVDVADRWQTLATQPVYIDEDGTLTIGFQSSKQGATDLAWRRIGDTASKGDHREGWWGATNFQLTYHPLYRISTTPEAYGTCCLPYDVAPSPGLTFYQIAGITHDCKNICLEEISETQAGVPFIYRADDTTATFMEHGEEVTTATDGPGNLRGFLKLRTATSRVPAGYYALGDDGAWHKVSSDNRPLATSFSGVIRPFNDRSSEQLTVFTSWNGPTMPIYGVTDEEIAAGMAAPTVNALPSATNAYDLQGRQASQGHSGIVISSKNGKNTKTIKK